MEKARILKRTRQAALAIPLYKEAIKLHPRDSEAHASLGFEYWELHNANPALADAAFKEEYKAIELDKNNPLPHHHLAAMFLELGLRPQAADEFRTEYTLAPWRNCHCGPSEGLMLQYPPGMTEFMSVMNAHKDDAGTTSGKPKGAESKLPANKQPSSLHE